MHVQAFKLRPGWVIRSPGFANGDWRPDAQGRRIVVIDPDPSPRSAHDASRTLALFAVETIDACHCDHTFSCCFWIDVTARRLKPDGSDDPNGERIAFSADGLAGDPFATVEVVGQMTDDGSAVSYALPKIDP